MAAAGVDPRIIGAALTGSAATGGEDPWSDIDLMFGLRVAGDLPAVLADWSSRMYLQHGALHHLDVPFGRAVYRAFLLKSTLQVDLAFAPAAEFGARAASFRLLFGAASELVPVPPPSAEHLIGLAWLHAVQARSCNGWTRTSSAAPSASPCPRYWQKCGSSTSLLPCASRERLPSLPPGRTGRRGEER